MAGKVSDDKNSANATDVDKLNDPCDVGPPGDVVDDQELRDLAGFILDDWTDLASALGLSKYDIFNVEQDNKGRHKEIVVQMLFKWKQQKGRAATYEVLTAALKKGKMMELVTPPMCQKIFKSCAEEAKPSG